MTLEEIICTIEETIRACDKYDHYGNGYKDALCWVSDMLDTLEPSWHEYPREKPTYKDNHAKPFLITIRQKDGYEFVTISVYHFQLSVFEMVGYYDDSSITAWAELPKPYKEEKA